MNYTDVSILCYGDRESSHDIASSLVRKLRSPTSNRCYFKFKCCKPKSSNAFNLVDGTKIEKLVDCWSYAFVSEKPLEIKNILYFEIEVLAGMYDGIYIGVTEDPIQSSFSGTTYKPTCAIYNNSNGNIGGNKNVKCTKGASAITGDVLGVVFDREKNEIRFYKNGSFVGRGSMKPSKFRVVYAFTSVFYSNQTIQLCEKYAYQDLKNDCTE